MTSTEVARYQSPPAPTVAELESIEKMASILSKTRLIPEYFYGKPDDIVIAGLGLRSNGLQLDANTLGQVYVVKGKPNYMAQIQIALARRAGIDIRFDQAQVTATGATVEIRDRTGWHSVTFTMADAVKGGLTSNACYAKFPDRMMLARAVTKAIDAYASHVKLGIDIDSDPQAMEHLAEDEIALQPLAGGDADAVEQGSPPGPAPASALERQLLHSLIDALTDDQRADLRERAKGYRFPNIDSDRFTSDDGRGLAGLIAAVQAEAETVRGSAVEEVGGADPDPQAGQPAPTYTDPLEEPFE